MATAIARIHDVPLPAPARREQLIAFKVKTDHMSRVAPAGSVIYLDFGDDVLVADKLYVVNHEDTAVLRRFRRGPDRFETDGAGPVEAIIPNSSTWVVGRCRYVEREI